MSVFDLLTESVTSRARSGNPLELLPARQWAVVTLLGSGMKATAIAKLHARYLTGPDLEHSTITIEEPPDPDRERPVR